MRSCILYILQLLLLIISHTTVDAQCSSTLTVSCITETGTPPSTSIQCSDPTHTLVSCGIRNNDTTITSKGTWRSLDECRIDSNTSTSITPYARCCDFTDCFPQHWHCTLDITRSKKTSPNSVTCASFGAHLLSCDIGIHNTQQTTSLYFDNNVASVQINIQDGYLALFSLPTSAPTITPTLATTTPTKHPTSSPTINSNTSPTISPTPKPTSPPTSPSSNPTRYPTSPPTKNPTSPPTATAVYTRDNGATYTYAQTVNQEAFTTYSRPLCYPQTQTVSDYLWLSTLCCEETSQYTDAPTSVTSAPIPSPTATPTAPTPDPATFRLADIQVVTTFTTAMFPLNATYNTSNEFQDFDHGNVNSITWGVSNTKRTYTKASNGGITGITDTELTDWYFTIKGWSGFGSSFTSEYGEIYIPSTQACTYCQCTSISDTINLIRVYADKTIPKVLGMTVETTGGLTITCHIDMGIKNQSGDEIYALLQAASLTESTNPAEYILNYTKCTGSDADGATVDGSTFLAGFQGSAHGFGIDYIGFHFKMIATTEATLSSCAYLDSTVTTPSPTAGTLDPTPSPTVVPTVPTGAPITPTTLKPTGMPVTDQWVDRNRSMACYYVLDYKQASCLADGASIKNPVASTSVTTAYTLTNPSFMTACVGYSEKTSIKSWYIESGTTDTCVVEGADATVEEVAAIATCCSLVNQKTVNATTFCETFSTTNPTEYCVLIFGGVSFVVLFWIGAIAWCIYTAKKTADREAKEKRLLEFKTRQTELGEEERILSEEQVDHRLDLNRFGVNEADIREMIENERMKSDDIGLVE